jgi:hypothetical protein
MRVEKICSAALAVMLLSVTTIVPFSLATAANADTEKPAQIVFYGEGRIKNSDEQSYALVRHHGTSMIISGNGEQVPVNELKRAIKDDFIWFRDGERGYVIVDPALLELADRAWRPYDDLAGDKRKEERSAAHKHAQAAMRDLINQARKAGKATPF